MSSPAVFPPGVTLGGFTGVESEPSRNPTAWTSVRTVG